MVTGTVMARVMATVMVMVMATGRMPVRKRGKNVNRQSDELVSTGEETILLLRA